MTLRLAAVLSLMVSIGACSDHELLPKPGAVADVEDTADSATIDGGEILDVAHAMPADSAVDVLEDSSVKEVQLVCPPATGEEPSCEFTDTKCIRSCGAATCCQFDQACKGDSGCVAYDNCLHSCVGYPFPDLGCKETCADSAGLQGVKKQIQLAQCRTHACIDYSKENCVAEPSKPTCPTACLSANCWSQIQDCISSEDCLAVLACSAQCGNNSCINACKMKFKHADKPVVDCYLDKCQ